MIITKNLQKFIPMKIDKLNYSLKITLVFLFQYF